MNRTLRALMEALALSTLLTLALTLAPLAMGEGLPSWWETGAVFFSFMSTWLCTRQVRLNYLFAVIATSILVYTFWDAHLYGSMVLNLYLVPTVIYGWFIWGRDTDSRPVEHVRPRAFLLYLFFTGITWLGAYLVITAAGGHMVALDGWLLVGTVLAQYLMDRKKLENWIVWALVNVVSVYVYFNSGLHLLALQFVLFLLNAVYAWFAWRRTMGEPAPVVELPLLSVAEEVAR